jgi:predicted helicase
MYVRFFRWASDRIHDSGIVAFITNRSFLDAGNFDGFRRVVESEFDHIYIVDLGGDWKKVGAAGSGNVFGIGTGVAIGFWIRKPSGAKRRATINYIAAPEGTGDNKLAWLTTLKEDAASFTDIPFQEIAPEDGFWLDHPEEAQVGLPICAKEVKESRAEAASAIFKEYSLGISTNRDEWLYDFDARALTSKVQLLISEYEKVRPGVREFPDTLKWSETLKRRNAQARRERYDAKRLRRAAYRPFVEKWLYESPLFIDRPGLARTFFPPNADNVAICFSDKNSRANYCVLATKRPTDLHFGASSDGYQQVARYRFVGAERFDNVTDWALRQFKARYAHISFDVTKDAIFAYTYGVLNDPVYTTKYALNLKRAFPIIPFYEDFAIWSHWGRALLKLHVDYDRVKRWPLRRIDGVDEKSQKAGVPTRVVLRADKDKGRIYVDGETELAGVPKEAWEYRLGTRSAIEWVLDQYSEGSYSNPLLREKIRPFRFAPHKEDVIALLGKVVRVSMETLRITKEMSELSSRARP